MKGITILLLLSVVWVMGCKQNDKQNNTGIERKAAANETEENIYRSADSMMAAFMRNDWKTFAGYNHPSMMKMMGGENNFVQFITEQMKHIPDTAIKKMGAGNILQVVKTDKDLQCIVEQHMQMILEGIDIKTITYLVGESLDEGKTWTFFDASSTGLITPKDVKPNLSAELIIPAQKKEIKQPEN